MLSFCWHKEYTNFFFFFFYFPFYCLFTLIWILIFMGSIFRFPSASNFSLSFLLLLQVDF